MAASAAAAVAATTNARDHDEFGSPQNPKGQRKYHEKQQQEDLEALGSELQPSNAVKRLPGPQQNTTTEFGSTTTKSESRPAFGRTSARKAVVQQPTSPLESSIRRGGAFRAAALATKDSSHQPMMPVGGRDGLCQHPESNLGALPEDAHRQHVQLSGAQLNRDGASRNGYGLPTEEPPSSAGQSGGRIISWRDQQADTSIGNLRITQLHEPDDSARRGGINPSTGSGGERSTVQDSVSSCMSPRTRKEAFRSFMSNRDSASTSADGCKRPAVTSDTSTSNAKNRSTSTWMKDVSQRSTASHKIPKISGGYKKVDDDGKFIPTSEALSMPRYMIHPFNPRYRTFLMVTVFWAAVTGLVTPWIVAFQTVPGLCPYSDFAAMFEYLAGAVFFVDICLSFNTAYYYQEILITDRRDIAKHYLRFRFWIDIIAVLPFDYAIIEGIWPPCYTSQTARYVSLLKLLRLLRMYRVLLFFKILEYNLAVGLMFSTITRNLVYVLYTCHWAGCAFYFIARQETLTEGTWLGMYPDLLTAWPSKIDSYIFSLYWAVTTVSTVGYGDFHAASIPEAVFTLVYMVFIIGLNAFIIGTLTLVVMKNDERTGQYRQRASNLKQYSSVNGIKPKLREEMQEHLRLHFNNEEAADEQVLGIYPSTIRRRILRFLYLQSLQKCYLFRECRMKYLDALLSVAKIELFMPGSEIFCEGDHVNELTIVVGGLLEVADTVQYVSINKGDDASVRGGSSNRGFRVGRLSMGPKAQRPIDADPSASVALASRRMLGPGAVVGEVAFFTEVPQSDSVRSVTVAKVLTVSRRHYADVSASYPIGARSTLENLYVRAEEVVQRELAAAGGLAALDALPEAIAFKWSTAEGGAMTNQCRPQLDHDSMAATRSALLQSGLSEHQERVVANALRIRTLIQQHVTKDDEQKTTDFLYAATKGDASKVQQMLRQDFAVDSSDYDNRTALMLASAKGHDDVIASLLSAGADPQLADNLGGTALHEACKAGHDSVVAILRRNKAELKMSRMDTASLLCKLVFDSNLPLLRRMIRAGIATNARDYDERTALHIAACEGNLTAVKLLVEEGDADIMLQDRWGRTALDEADRLGARFVIKYLQDVMADLAEAATTTSAVRPSGKS